MMMHGGRNILGGMIQFEEVVDNGVCRKRVYEDDGVFKGGCF